MNKGHHMSYQYSKVNKKGDTDNGEVRSGPDYTRLPQCLSYMEQLMEEQKNDYYFGQFQHLQGWIGHSMTLMP